MTGGPQGARDGGTERHRGPRASSDSPGRRSAAARRTACRRGKRWILCPREPFEYGESGIRRLTPDSLQLGSHGLLAAGPHRHDRRSDRHLDTPPQPLVAGAHRLAVSACPLRRVLRSAALGRGTHRMGLAPQRRLVQRRGMGGWTCLVAGGRRRGDGFARGVLGSESAATVHVSPVSLIRCYTERDFTATWEAYLPVPDTVPLATQRVVLTLELMMLAIAFEATWWAIKRSRSGRDGSV